MLQKLKENISLLRTEIHPAEYLLWWAVRICMLIYIIRQLREEHEMVNYVLPFLNALGSFAVFFVRMLFPRRNVLGKISYRAQKYITVMVLFGSFIGNYFGLYGVDNPLHYDWILHAISGWTITMLGFHLLVAMNDDKTRLTPQLAACGSMGFSFFLMIAWEIMEFCGDFLFGDNNQKYNWLEIKPTDPFYPLFTKGVPGSQQFPLIDTMMDLTLAFFVTLFTGTLLYLILTRREKKAAQTETAQGGVLLEV